MFCSGCGQILDANQQACPKCGKPVLATPATPAAPAPYQPAHAQLPTAFRVQRNIQTLGILWIVFAFWNVLQVVITATVLTGMTGLLGNRFGMNPGLFWDRFPFYNMAWFVPLLTAIAIARAILSAATGLALLRRAPWARKLALVSAFLTLIKPVLGTMLAIYTLRVLISDSSRREYESISVP